MSPKALKYYYGDLGGSRTRVVGMKTRCTNRYTTRPVNSFFIIPNS